MPTYEFQCKNCQNSFEIYRAFSDTSVIQCPACGSSELKKVFGNVGIVFKGGGFYKTETRQEKNSSGEPSKPNQNANSGKDNKSDTTASSQSAQNNSKNGTPNDKSSTSTSNSIKQS